MFCPECGGILLPKKEKDKKVFKCAKCGYSTSEGEGKLSEKSKKEEKEIEVVSKQQERMPTCEAKCEKCGNTKAYYYLQQTRAADEAPTKFMKCTECGHTWRDYN